MGTFDFSGRRSWTILKTLLSMVGMDTLLKPNVIGRIYLLFETGKMYEVVMTQLKS
jgi:hypothetical protein